MSMKVKDLKKQIEDAPDDMEVFVRCISNPCANIVQAKKAAKSTYGFFGIEVECIIIEPDK